MRRKIRNFRQHTNETCGPSCILILLDHYRKIHYPTMKMEEKIYQAYRSRAFAGTSASAIANCLSKNHLNVRLVQSFHDKMDNLDRNNKVYFSPDLYEKMQQEYDMELQACKQRISLITDTHITCDYVKEELAADRQVILLCIVPGCSDGIHDETLHWIVVYQYNSNKDFFLACDPSSHKIQITSEELEEYMNTPIGRICISVSNK